MEEAWELAVVSETSPKSKSHKLVYNDYDERTYRANSKFEFSAIFSIAISYLDLSEESSLIGLKFDNINETQVELVAFIFAVGLGVNYFLRLKDEGKIISRLDADVRLARQRIRNEVELLRSETKFDSISDDLSKQIRELEQVTKLALAVNVPKLLEYIETAKNALMAVKDEQADLSVEAKDITGSKFVTTHMTGKNRSRLHHATNTILVSHRKIDESLQKMSSFSVRMKSWDKLHEQINGFPAKMVKLNNSFNEFSGKITDEVSKNQMPLLMNESQPIWVKLRLKIFLLWVPLGLMVLCLTSYLYTVIQYFGIFQ